MTALRANARLLLDRLACVGRGGAVAAAERRNSSRLLFAARASLRAGRGPQVWRLQI